LGYAVPRGALLGAVIAARGIGREAEGAHTPVQRSRHLREGVGAKARDGFARSDDAGYRALATLLRDDPARGAGSACAALGGAARHSQVVRSASCQLVGLTLTNISGLAQFSSCAK
jgi:hypothetical protein